MLVNTSQLIAEAQLLLCVSRTLNEQEREAVVEIQPDLSTEVISGLLSTRRIKSLNSSENTVLRSVVCLFTTHTSQDLIRELAREDHVFVVFEHDDSGNLVAVNEYTPEYSQVWASSTIMAVAMA